MLLLNKQKYNENIKFQQEYSKEKQKSMSTGKDCTAIEDIHNDAKNYATRQMAFEAAVALPCFEYRSG